MKKSSSEEEHQNTTLETLMKRMASTRVKFDERFIQQRDIPLYLHISHHPNICWIDIYKFILQGTCGWRHLLIQQNPESVYQFLIKEFNEITPLKDEPIFELLDTETEIGRVHLKTWKYYGLSIDDLWKAMNNIAISTNSLALFKKRWQELKNFFKKGILISSSEDDEYVKLWLELVEVKAQNSLSCDGLGLVSHSQLFRKSYNPSYRLALKEDIEEILFNNGISQGF